MKTNVQIELTDAERNKLKHLIDGKPSKKMVSRKEVIAICQQHIGGLINSLTPAGAAMVKAELSRKDPATVSDLYTPDPADIPLMAQPNNPGYVRGWNLVKRGAAR